MADSNQVRLSKGQKLTLLDELRKRRASPEGRSSPKLTVENAGNYASLPNYTNFQTIRKASALLGIADPYFKAHDGRAGATTTIDGTEYQNFSSYDYLGLNGHPEVIEAAKSAIDRYGVSASASRLVAGERPIHRELEERLACFHGVEASLTFVSGHATNVTVIGQLLGRGDLILYDELSHNSVLQGAQLSGARRLAFAHNSVESAQAQLESVGGRVGRVLIVIEGHYSMDGDVPNLPDFVDLARRTGAWLMVDEAHAVGVLGKTGRGVAEHFGMDPDGVDLWMGTLSKALAGCGGYIAGRRELIDYLKVSAPGFVYSVGMSPPLAATAIAALQVLEREPQRVAKLNRNAQRFLYKAKAAGLPTGQSGGFAIVPLLTGGSIAAARISRAMADRRVNVQPILYPAVPERSARLRFFFSCEHSSEQIDYAIDSLVEAKAELQAHQVDMGELARSLAQQL